ncbi:MAG: LacI family DNA-binding transcriptional regulator [Candidatus Caldatribacteriaceae bacterium]
MATLREIAEKAGVSITTVSHILNDTRPVSEALRKKVFEAMESLGIEIPAVQRRKVRSQLIAMLIDDVFNPFFTEVFASAEATARSMDYNLLLLSAIEQGEDLLYLRDLENRRIDGLIVATRLSISYLKKAFSTQLPMVFLGGNLEVPFSSSVLLPDERGAYLATKHLVELGHSQILCVGGSAKFSIFRDRFQGYVRALEEAKIPVDKDFMVEINLTFLEAYRFGMEFLPGFRNKVTAVFTHNDPTACGIMKAAQALGIRIPEELSVVGFDNTFVTQITHPRLTSVNLPKKLIGKRLVEVLVRLIRGNSIPGCTIEEVGLDIKESTTFAQ